MFTPLYLTLTLFSLAQAALKTPERAICVFTRGGAVSGHVSFTRRATDNTCTIAYSLSGLSEGAHKCTAQNMRCLCVCGGVLGSLYSWSFTPLFFFFCHFGGAFFLFPQGTFICTATSAWTAQWVRLVATT
jgi:hypothetical protein